MRTKTIAELGLEDVLMRLGAGEEQVVVTASSTSGGWGNCIAWNPVDIFKQKSDKATEIVSSLDAFVSKQQSLGCLTVGYESYDFGCMLQDVTLKERDENSMPLVFAASFDNWITFLDGKATIHYSDESYLRRVDSILSRDVRLSPIKLYNKSLSPSNDRRWYKDAYLQIKDYIKSGDIYQVNLTHGLSGSTNAESRDMFCTLHQKSKVDFQSYIEVDGYEILSFSPERFIKIEERVIETSPIKGTRERGSNMAEDERLKQELLDSSKERAELNMITDLLRNDLGRICEVGSIEVTERRTLKAYPTLWHAHSTISGVLTKNISPINALSSMMPGGSITGCPKKRAIEIIDELETRRRGLYTGSIFVIKPNGMFDSSIAIRTMVKNRRQLNLSVGGGIVNDSNEDDEYQESIDKAMSFIEPTNPRELSSDILEKQFGPTDIEIIYQDNNCRVICTKAKSSGKILELSLVEFIDSGTKAYPKIHELILSGQSIGKAFRTKKVEFARATHSTFLCALPDVIQKKFEASELASVVDVTVVVGPDKRPYAKILETYSPEVVWADKIADPTPDQLTKIKRLAEFIEPVL